MAQNFNLSESLSTWIRKIPMCTLGVICVTAIESALCLLWTGLALQLINTPYDTILSMQLYRICTAPFLTPSILGFCFFLLSYCFSATRLEQDLGTLRYFTYLATNSSVHTDALAQLLHISLLLFIDALVGKVYFDPLAYPSFGLWPVIVCDLVVLCNWHSEGLTQYESTQASANTNFHQEQTRSSAAFLYISAIRIHLEHYNRSIDRLLEVTEGRVTRWEKSWLIARFSTSQRFIPVSRSGNRLPLFTPDTGKAGFVPFSGKGYVLKDGQDESSEAVGLMAANSDQ